MFFRANEFFAYVKRLNDFNEMVRRELEYDDKSHMFVEYRELLEPNCHIRLQQFLGVENLKPLDTHTLKQNVGSLRNRFDNWSDVEEALAQGEMERWLEENDDPAFPLAQS